MLTLCTYPLPLCAYLRAHSTFCRRTGVAHVRLTNTLSPYSFFPFLFSFFPPPWPQAPSLLPRPHDAVTTMRRPHKLRRVDGVTTRHVSTVTMQRVDGATMLHLNTSPQRVNGTTIQCVDPTTTLYLDGMTLRHIAWPQHQHVVWPQHCRRVG